MSLEYLYTTTLLPGETGVSVFYGAGWAGANDLWRLLEGGPLTGYASPTVGLVALGYTEDTVTGKTGGWTLWHNVAPSAPYRYAMTVPLPTGEVMTVWLPDEARLMQWLSRYGGIISLIT
jgi:hypothetical protein